MTAAQERNGNPELLQGSGGRKKHKVNAYKTEADGA
jgi:hypothetical protein